MIKMRAQSRELEVGCLYELPLPRERSLVEQGYAEWVGDPPEEKTERATAEPQAERAVSKPRRRGRPRKTE